MLGDHTQTEDQSRFAHNGKPFAVDLVATVEALPASAEYSRVRGMVEASLSVESASEDLLRCAAALKLITAHAQTQAAADQATPEQGIVIGALVTEAVILYMRAVQTSEADQMAGRKKVGLFERIPSELRCKHEQIKTLRNGSIAHFGVGSNHRVGPWNRETLILATDGVSDPWILGQTIRMNGASEVVSDLNELVAAALRSIGELRAEKNGKLGAELLRLYESDKGFREVAMKNEFDGLAFFGDSDAAQAWRRAVETGNPRWTGAFAGRS